MAQLEACQADPTAHALLLDTDGNITEVETGNFMIARAGTLIFPPEDHSLAGITRATTMDLARDLGIAVQEHNIQIYDAINADEAFTTSTSYCVLPVTRINGVVIGEGVPGPMWRRLMEAWNTLLGKDVVAQALVHIPPDELDELRKTAENA